MSCFMIGSPFTPSGYVGLGYLVRQGCSDTLITQRRGECSNNREGRLQEVSQDQGLRHLLMVKHTVNLQRRAWLLPQQRGRIRA